jgi:predicted DNA-binding transcriptional regulator AlpA
MSQDSTPQPQPRYARVDAASKICGIPPSTLWQYARTGVIPPPIKFGPRTTLFDIPALLTCIAAKADTAPDKR